MFASWARRIWIVTDQQVPRWLKPDERLRVVDHREIFADPAALPVFNSHAIESQLHHIPGLAERYLYLNDDMLFGAPVRPEHFFHGNGLSKVFVSRAALIDPVPTARRHRGRRGGEEQPDLIEQTFGRTITSKLWHTPQPQSRPLIATSSRARRALRHGDAFEVPACRRLLAAECAHPVLRLRHQPGSDGQARLRLPRPRLGTGRVHDGDVAPAQEPAVHLFE